MSISIYIAPIANGVELVEQLLHSEFNIDDSSAKSLSQSRVKPHFDRLKTTCYQLAETCYVDRVYRDSYYHYYSSKLSGYNRDCIRISIFEGVITADDFRLKEKKEYLQNLYRGFFILRPTEPFIIGRSVLSPKALTDNTFFSCTAIIPSTVNGIKFSVEGFPHSSQDTETITCAETTLWAVMEYFANKYPDYKPIFPSKITDTLNKITSERQVPSRGLNIQQMSFALKEFGFGTRIYARANYTFDFEKLLSTYVESGIPLILGIDNRHAGGNIGHAVLCVGHEKIEDKAIDNIAENQITNKKLFSVAKSKELKIYDLDDVKKEFVFIDDNQPAYKKAMLADPTAHYALAWQGCTIKHFIVPLYHKIYLEAYEARNLVLTFLIQGLKPLQDKSEVLIKFFLTSSRSFKDALALNDSFQEDIRDMILETAMPKFIWVTEISNKKLIQEGKADGIILIDATEANKHSLSIKPLILAAYQSNLIKFDLGSRKLKNSALSLQPFKIYSNNLRNL